MIKIGTDSLGYNHLRNFAGLPFKRVSFHKVHDPKKIISYAIFKLFGKIDHKNVNRFNDFGLNSVDLYHFFNSLTPVKKPWIVTFEHTLPRHDPDFVEGYDWMGSDYCKKIIAFSKRAFDAQIFLLNNKPFDSGSIKEKMVILQPSQGVLLDDLSLKTFDGKIIFTFVGNAFFRKGGWEILKAFENFKKFHSEIKLIIISKLAVDGYRDHHITAEQIEATKRLISDNPLIEYHSYLPNPQVLEILKKSHVGILPSWGETYGYSVLESMACGCAVVVPDVSPFPEFVSSEWGWLIKVEKNMKDGLEESLFTEQNSQKMIAGIISIVNGILNDRVSLKAKCNNALKRVAVAHCPEFAVSFLENTYLEALHS